MILISDQDLVIASILIGFIVILVILLTSKREDREPEKFGVESITERGETVRSIAEKLIADYFHEHRVEYEYEPDVSSVGRADFYLPEYDVYVEYWGLIDADDELLRRRYVRSMKQKMASYYRNDLKFISIYPRNMDNLDWIFRTKFRDATGFDLPN